MPWKKKGSKYVSPSGREWTKQQILAYCLRKKGDGEMSGECRDFLRGKKKSK